AQAAGNARELPAGWCHCRCRTRRRTNLSPRANEAVGFDRVADRVVVDAEGGGDGADPPVLRVVEAADLRALLRRDHGSPSAPRRGTGAHVGQRRVAHEAAGAATARTARAGDGARDIGIVSVLLAARVVDGRRGDDAGGAGVVGSLMRHFLPPGPVARLARGVVQTPTAAVLVASAGGAERRPPRLLRARRRAVAIAAIAVTAEEGDAGGVDTRG